MSSPRLPSRCILLLSKRTRSGKIRSRERNLRLEASRSQFHRFHGHRICVRGLAVTQGANVGVAAREGEQLALGCVDRFPDLRRVLRAHSERYERAAVAEHGLTQSALRNLRDELVREHDREMPLPRFAEDLRKGERGTGSE